MRDAFQLSIPSFTAVKRATNKVVVRDNQLTKLDAMFTKKIDGLSRTLHKYLVTSPYSPDVDSTIKAQLVNMYNNQNPQWSHSAIHPSFTFISSKLLAQPLPFDLCVHAYCIFYSYFLFHISLCIPNSLQALLWFCVINHLKMKEGLEEKSIYVLVQTCLLALDVRPHLVSVILGSDWIWLINLSIPLLHWPTSNRLIFLLSIFSPAVSNRSWLSLSHNKPDSFYDFLSQLDRILLSFSPYSVCFILLPLVNHLLRNTRSSHWEGSCTSSLLI